VSTGGGLRGARSVAHWREGGHIDLSYEQLLHEGLQSYARSIGIIDTDQVRWQIGRSLERPYSSVYHVNAALGAGSSVVCYLKTFRVPPDRPDMERRLRDRVLRSRWLAEHVGKPSVVAVPPILASDPDQLAIVFLAVEGEPLGKAWNYLVRGRIRSAREQFLRVGRAIREIESLSLQEAEPSSYLDRPNVREAIMDALPYLEDGDAHRMLERVDELYHLFARKESQSYFSHGDVNHSNVLLDRDHVYLIDFDLSSRPVTFDLSLFLLRLELERPAFRPWSDAIATWTAEGYGAPDIRSDPAFALVRLIKLSDSIMAAASREDQRRLGRYVSILEKSLLGS